MDVLKSFNIKDQKNNIMILVAVVVVVYLGYMVMQKRKKVNETSPKEKNEVQAANGPSVNGSILMYGKDSCPWCKRQKTELKDHWSKVTYVNCQENPEECKKNNVAALPTWVIHGDRSEGFMKKEKFEEKCNL
tara:strand:+ start:151 stop:549 length:399 start_codon:yes stop_codon:yes gene_type:complete